MTTTIISNIYPEDKDSLEAWGAPEIDVAREVSDRWELTSLERAVSGAANWYQEHAAYLRRLVDCGAYEAIRAWGESGVWMEVGRETGDDAESYATGVAEALEQLATALESRCRPALTK